MKKVLAAFVVGSLLIGSLEAATPKADPRLELMKDMRTMMDAMEQIQRGGL